MRGCGLVVREQMMDKAQNGGLHTEEKASESRVCVPTSYSVHDKDYQQLSVELTETHSTKTATLHQTQMWRLRKWQIRSRVHSSVIEPCTGNGGVGQTFRQVIYSRSSKRKICNHIPQSLGQRIGSRSFYCCNCCCFVVCGLPNTGTHVHCVKSQKQVL